MKHIIIYLAIALVMFGLLGWYFAQQEDLQPKALQAELSVSNVAKLPQQKVEMLFSDMSNEEKNSFRIAIQNELGAAVDVAAHDCMGSAEVQMTYAKKVLEQGCTVLMLEPVNDTVTDELLALAQEYDVPVVLMNRRATAEQLATFSKLYSILKADDSEEAELERLADTIADYWEKNRDDLDNWLHDDKLSIAAVTEYGYEESGKWAKLQSLLEERGCTAKLTKDVVTEYLNYNLEYSLDAIYYSGAELLLFSDSADAEKANVYYNDPTEYSNGYRAWRVVMEADETAYNLYKDGKVLFAEGSGGYMMGRAAAQILRLLLEGQIPRVSSSLASQTDGGKTFLCNPVVLRNVIETVEPEEQDTNSSRTAAVGIS